MLFLVGLTVVGFAAALALGGTLSAWRSVRVRWWVGVVLALAVQLVVYNPPFDSQPWALAWGPWLFVLAKATLVVVLLANAIDRKAAGLRAGWALATLGVTLNLVVVAANGGYMPQSIEARVLVRGTTLFEGETTTRLHNVKPIDESTRLVWLGDVVPQPTWLPRANVMSIGDLLLSVGLGIWAFQVTLRARRKLIVPAIAADT